LRYFGTGSRVQVHRRETDHSREDCSSSAGLTAGKLGASALVERLLTVLDKGDVLERRAAAEALGGLEALAGKLAE